MMCAKYIPAEPLQWAQNSEELPLAKKDFHGQQPWGKEN